MVRVQETLLSVGGVLGRSREATAQDSLPSFLSQFVQSGLIVLFRMNPNTVRDQFILLYTKTLILKPNVR